MNAIDFLKNCKWEYQCYQRGKSVLNNFCKKKKHAFVFGSPYHANLGDQAQTYCIIRWLKHNYSEHQVLVFDTPSVMGLKSKNLYAIKKMIGKDDLIFLHSGYHMTDLYLYEEQMHRKVIQLFPDNKIIILPQTILFKSEMEKKKTIEIYRVHKHLLLLCRDEASYATAKSMFDQIRIECFPDVVTTMIGEKNYTNERTGVMFCVRNDVEAKYSKQEYKRLEEAMKQYGNIEYYDTTVETPVEEIMHNREKILEETWEKFSKYRLVVTDRYHGTIFSMIAQTPVIVLSSSDHKLESGVKWFPDSMKNQIVYATSIDDVPQYAKKMIENIPTPYEGGYFVDHYYSKLRGIIDEI